jgi:Fe-S-cluster containining protein
MVWGFLRVLFSRSLRLPRDRVTRLPRRARKAAAPAAAAMEAALAKIAAMPGIADVATTKRAPKGLYEETRTLLRAYDDYIEATRVHLKVVDARRPGEPGGTSGCYESPMGVSAIEQLLIYRTIRPWRDFPEVAQKLAARGEQQFRDISERHTGKDPEKLRLSEAAAFEGRIAFAKRKLPCPLLDEGKQRCRIWDVRPMVCRMHHPTGAPELHDPADASWPTKATAVNVRPSIKAQLELSQLEKRMGMQLAPFLDAGPLQLLQLAEGQLIQEVGEAPQRMQADGQVAPKANRNVAHAKKFQKDKRKGGKPGKPGKGGKPGKRD